MGLPDVFHEIASRVNNWGRWGNGDEIGTLNLVTDEVVREAAACVRTGRRFSLALPLDEDGPQTGVIPGRANPIHSMIAVNEPLTSDPAAFCSSDDVVFMGLQAGTHWDALAHVSYDGRLYNGFHASSVTGRGTAHCGIHRIGTLVSRGVLLDVARAAGRDRLAGGHAVGRPDLDAAEEIAGTAVRAGDIVLVRTGQMRAFQDGDRDGYAFPSPGPGLEAVEWFAERDVAAVATDNLTFEVYPGEHEGLELPVHLLHLVEMGLTQGQNFDLEELAEDCAGDGVYEFFLEATPEPFVHALGAPVNPIAIK